MAERSIAERQARHRRELIATALDLARARDGRRAFIGHIELYCEHPACSVRTLDIHFKEFSDPLPPRLPCPACRRQLKLHHVRTMDEQAREDEREARASVNPQRWQRDHPDEWLMPLSVFCDEELP